MTGLGEEKGTVSSRGKKGFNSSKELLLSSFLKLLFAVRLSNIKAIYQHAHGHLSFDTPYFRRAFDTGTLITDL